MRLANFCHNGRASHGLVVEREGKTGVIDLGIRAGHDPNGLDRLLASGFPVELEKLAAEGTPDLDIEELLFAPVVRRPAKIVCVGLNYDAHRAESGREKTTFPILFTRFANTLVGHGQALLRPIASVQFDFEGELAVVIGRAGRRIPPSRAFEHVAGYTCFNDATLRDWQRHTHQFTPGKNFPSTAGLGPWLVTCDEIPDPQKLTLETRVNGQPMQQAHTADMIFPVDQLIAYISSFTELVAGDVIATGTPSGVGFARNPPIFLHAGDQVEVEISEIGILVNPIADEIAAP